MLVTGTKGGIGHETAQGIGNSGATVLVHGRRVDDAQRAVDLLVNNGNGKGQYLPVAADLGSLAGVRQLVNAVHEAAPKGLNGLVNNAGAAFSSKALSPDGYERTIAITLAPSLTSGSGRIELAAHIPGVEARLLDDDGHLTLMQNRVPEVHAWLSEHL